MTFFLKDFAGVTKEELDGDIEPLLLEVPELLLFFDYGEISFLLKTSFNRLSTSVSGEVNVSDTKFDSTSVIFILGGFLLELFLCEF